MFLIKIYYNYIMPVISHRNALRRKAISLSFINLKKKGANNRFKEFKEFKQKSKAVNKKRGKTKKNPTGRSPLYKNNSTRTKSGRNTKPRKNTKAGRNTQSKNNMWPTLSQAMTQKGKK